MIFLPEQHDYEWMDLHQQEHIWIHLAPNNPKKVWTSGDSLIHRLWIQSGPVSRLGRMLKESLCDLKGKNGEWWVAPIVLGGVSVGGYQPEVENDHPFRICFWILYCLNSLFYISEIGFTRIGQETKACSFAVFGMFVSSSWCVAYAPNKFLVLPSLHPLAKMRITCR